MVSDTCNAMKEGRHIYETILVAESSARIRSISAPYISQQPRNTIRKHPLTQIFPCQLLFQGRTALFTSSRSPWGWDMRKRALSSPDTSTALIEETTRGAFGGGGIRVNGITSRRVGRFTRPTAATAASSSCTRLAPCPDGRGAGCRRRRHVIVNDDSRMSVGKSGKESGAGWFVAEKIVGDRDGL